jgi:two-component system sensor histidine kinase YesM
MVRNLLDQDFEPYAALVMALELEEVFQSLYHIGGLRAPSLTVDGVPVLLLEEDGEGAAAPSKAVVYRGEADGHTLELSAFVAAGTPWSNVPMLRWAIVAVALLVVPLLAVIVWLFRRHVSRPIDTMIAAAAHVQAGERGYQIAGDAPSREFALLYNHFNAMSAELESQFDRSYQEQQALQQAKIKALQSQINPHFLNNTLEIINWEARLADNQRVCSMIEALSTMLDAAISRDGRSTVTLAEELKYVDAYLYITQERLGDRLTVTRDVDPEVMGWRVLLMMLQPIVENAVEHDLSRSGGELCLRAYPRRGAGGARLCVEVEHDGAIPARDWENIRRSLEPQSGGQKPGGSVGIRNVNQRLRLLYGEDYRFDMAELRPGRILTRLEIPGEEGGK